MNKIASDATARIVLLACLMLLAGCGRADPDYCQHLSLPEAQQFDADISESAMRQTEGFLYCVWGDGKSDELFISLNLARDYSSAEFLSVVAKNSPEPDEELVRLTGIGNDAAALFLGEDGKMQLDFLVAQNRDYSITIRAHDVASPDSERFAALKDIAATVLDRL